MTSQQYYQFIIIGAGIGGIQAGLILAEHNKNFLILQANNKLGGRIATDKLGNIITDKQINGQNIDWLLKNNEEVMDVAVDYGATWVSIEHTYMMKVMKDFGIRIYPQYFDGLTIYGVDSDNYQRVQSLIQHYKNYKKDIKRLLDKIDSIKNSFENLLQQEQNRNSRQQLSKDHKQTTLLQSVHEKQKIPKQSFSLLNQYIDYYDNITVKDFIRNQLKNQFLIDQILNQIQILECMGCDKFNMIQLIDDDGSLQLLKLYCEKVENNIDGFKARNGMLSVIKSLSSKLLEELRQNRNDQGLELSDILKLNSPVSRIQNQIGQDVKVYIKNSDKVYTCNRILFSAPVAVAGQITITKISPSKKLIFNNQQMGNVTRLYMVFKTAFWRGRYSGYGSFSSKFPFSQMTDLSPANLACGILVFIFIGDKYKKWVKEYSNQKVREHIMKNIVANMFLKGNQQSPHLQNTLMYARTFCDNEYIRAAYQATTKPHIWKQVKENGDEYTQAYSRDEYNIIYIGSQFAEEHATYMEGALRLSREKTYNLLGKQDPWKYLKN